MKHARLLSLSLLALLSTFPIITMEKGEGSQAPKKAKKKKLTPEEKREQALEILNLTMKKIKLATLQMQYSALTIQSLVHNNNNAQPTATLAVPVATAPHTGSSNSQAPEKPFTVQDLLAHHKNMNQVIKKTSALIDTVITERCDELKSNNNNNNNNNNDDDDGE